jgi:putative membrane protein
MKNAFTRLCLLGVALALTDLFMGSIQIEGSALIGLTIILAILNGFVKPFLKLITLPLTILTFGIFSLFVNAIVLSLAFNLSGGAYAANFTSIFFASILLSIISSVIGVTKDRD